MTSENHFATNGGSIEDNARGFIRRGKDNLSEQMQHMEDSVRESPRNSVLVAGLVGYFLHILPIGALLSGVVRLLAALIRPAIFLYIAAKVIDGLRNSASASQSVAKSDLTTP